MVFGYGHGYPFAQGASHIMPSTAADRAQEYDRALQQSMSAARRRHPGSSAAGPAAAAPTAAGRPAIAQHRAVTSIGG